MVVTSDKLEEVKTQYSQLKKEVQELSDCNMAKELAEKEISPVSNSEFEDLRKDVANIKKQPKGYHHQC